MNKYQPTLIVYIIWHPDADALCRPLAQAVYTCLKRDPEAPFARSIGITTYFRYVWARCLTAMRECFLSAYLRISSKFDLSYRSSELLLIPSGIVFDSGHL